MVIWVMRQWMWFPRISVLTCWMVELLNFFLGEWKSYYKYTGRKSQNFFSIGLTPQGIPVTTRMTLLLLRMVDSDKRKLHVPRASILGGGSHSPMNTLFFGFLISPLGDWNDNSPSMKKLNNAPIKQAWIDIFFITSKSKLRILAPQAKVNPVVIRFWLDNLPPPGHVPPREIGVW